MNIAKPLYPALGTPDTTNASHIPRSAPSSSTTVSFVRGVGNQSSTAVPHSNPVSRQMSAGSNSPTSMRVKQMYGTNFSVDAATYQHLIDRRKSFRFRGSLVGEIIKLFVWIYRAQPLLRLHRWNKKITGHHGRLYRK